jgi:hypothetical protein
MPASWLDVMCKRCLALVHRGLAQLLLYRWHDITTWSEFLRALKPDGTLRSTRRR